MDQTQNTTNPFSAPANPVSTEPVQNPGRFKPNSNGKLSKKHLFIFIAIFAIIGSYFIWKSFAATVIFVNDSFGSANGTSLQSRTGQTGATWTKHPAYTASAAVITDAQRLRTNTTNTTVYYASGTPISANYTVEADIFVRSIMGSAGVTARTSTTAHTFYTCRYSASVAKWELVKFVNGTATFLGSKAETLTPGSTYRLKLITNGSTQSCAVNNSTIMSVRDTSITATGRAGLRFFGASTLNNSTGLHIDNFIATTIDQPVAPTVSLTATPEAITSGKTATLTWSSTNATSCTASGAWTGARATSGTFTTSALSTSTTYTLACVGSGGTVSKSVTVNVTAPQPPAPTTSKAIYWGARIDGDVYGDPTNDAPWDNAVWDKFEQHTKKKVSLVHFGQPAPWNQKFSVNPFEATVKRGAVPVVSMDTGNVKLSDIAAGAYDTSITTWAKDAKAWGRPLMIRLNWEMNGTWYNWGKQAKENPANFVNSWRRMHDIFKNQGATNVTWVWCVNVEFSGSTPLDKLYPGDAYVDWTAIDGYNWGSNPLAPYGWKTFSQTFTDTYKKLVASYPTKPIMIAEIGSTEYGGSKSAWITDALKQLPTNFPQVKALVWFNWNIMHGSGRFDWQIESSTAAQNAFATGISSSYYAGNNFSNPTPLTKVKPIQ